jgi:phosphate/sulfate permease
MKIFLEILAVLLVLVVVGKACLTLGYCMGWSELQVQVGEKLAQYRREGRGAASELSYEINRILNGISKKA